MTLDPERQFYTVLDEALDSDALPSADDFIKVTDGPQARVADADGNVAVLIMMTPEGVAMLLNAVAHAHAHDCESARSFATYFMTVAGSLVASLGE